MGESSPRVGRPRKFDEGEVLDQAVDVFWRHGGTGTTTRVLERELSLTQSSIYNAFGSKPELLKRSLDRYLERIDDEVVAVLDQPEAGLEALLDFVANLMEWIGQAGKPGCLLLNLLAEGGPDDKPIVNRAEAYRDRLRSTFRQAFAQCGAVDPAGHAEVLLSTVLGINIAARGGAGRSELETMAGAVRSQIKAWSDPAQQG